MREIKFRAWDDNRKIMLHHFGIDSTGMIWAEGDKPQPHWRLMQFTGLKDKNGKEIYSGDFVRQSGTLYEIQDCKGGWDCQIWKELKNGGAVEGSCYDFTVLLDYACEVVGNRYENPALLNSDTNPEPSVASKV